MKYSSIFAFYTLLCCTMAVAQETVLQNAYNRTSVSLNGEWNYIIDPYETGFYDYRLEPYDASETVSSGALYTNTKPKDKSDLIEYDFDASETLLVPGDWNTQAEKLLYYEGTIWYKKSFDYKKKANSNKVFLYFGGCNYKADVYLNGRKVGQHTGGFTPFNFEVGAFLNEKDNFLIIRVDNKREREAVPTINTDWWNYGGLTRDIKLIETPATYIQDYFLQLDPKNAKKLKGYVQLNGDTPPGKVVKLTIPELKVEKEISTDSSGKISLEIPIKKVDYWSPDSPKLYEVTIMTDEDRVTDKIGLRTIATKGSDILLNGDSIFLKGICIHEERLKTTGRANTEEDARELLSLVKEMGANYVRLAHYPHNEYMVRLADEMGILVWEENPVYWTILWDNPDTYKNAENQLREVIHRDKNRASVIIWSMGNETPVSEARTQFLTKLANVTRRLDNTRLISAALEQTIVDGNDLVRTIEDPFAAVVDVLSFNQYVGWYDGLPEKIDTIRWQIQQDKPVLISEFGAGAKFGKHGDSLTRWSEEYQADLYRRTIQMLERIPQYRGVTPWILKDFRSPKRFLAKIQDGYNRKGLVSEKGEKKQAFFDLQRYYIHKEWKK